MMTCGKFLFDGDMDLLMNDTWKNLIVSMTHQQVGVNGLTWHHQGPPFGRDKSQFWISKKSKNG